MSGPSALASWGPWGRCCRGARSPARSRERSWVRRSVHRLAKTAPRSRFGAFVYTVAPLWAAVVTQECTQIGENGLSDPFWVICVHCCDARVASGGTRAPTAMVCWQRPLGGPPLPWPGNRLCASGAAARLAFSLRCQPTQTPEEPAFCTVSFLLLRGFTLLSVRELRKDDRDGTTIGIASGFLTRINEGHSPKEAPL